MVTYFKERFWEVCWENKSLISERKIHFGIEIYYDWNNKCDPRGFATSTFDLPLCSDIWNDWCKIVYWPYLHYKKLIYWFILQNIDKMVFIFILWQTL